MKLSATLATSEMITEEKIVRKKRLFWPRKSNVNELKEKILALNEPGIHEFFEQVVSQYRNKYGFPGYRNGSLTIIVSRRKNSGDNQYRCKLRYSERWDHREMQSVSIDVPFELGKKLLFFRDKEDWPTLQYVKFREVTTKNVHDILWLDITSKQYLWRHFWEKKEVNITPPSESGNIEHHEEYHHLQYK